MNQTSGVPMPKQYTLVQVDDPKTAEPEYRVAGDTVCVVIYNGIKDDGEPEVKANSIFEELGRPYPVRNGKDLYLFFNSDFKAKDYDLRFLWQNNIADGIEVKMDGLEGSGSFPLGVPAEKMPCLNRPHLSEKETFSFLCKWMAVKRKRRQLQKKESQALRKLKKLSDEFILKEMKISEREGAKWTSVFEDKGGLEKCYYPNFWDSIFTLTMELLYWTGPDQNRIMGMIRNAPFYNVKWGKAVDKAIEALVILAINTRKDGQYWNPKKEDDGSDGGDGEKKKKRPLISHQNFREFLKEIGLEVRFNLLTHRLEYPKIPDEEEFQQMHDVVARMPGKLQFRYRDYLGVQSIPKSTIEDLLMDAGDYYAYNPVGDYFKSLKWDGTSRIDTLCEDILGVDDSFSKKLIYKAFLQAVALVFNGDDGKDLIASDGVLVLVGEVGKGKTQFFRQITPNKNEWFASYRGRFNVNNKDVVMEATSNFITEFGEMDATLKSPYDIKAFITDTQDIYRVPYGHTHSRTPRKTSFWGSSNDEELITLTDGDRRFWIVEIEDFIKWKEITPEFRDQLWAEFYQEYLKNPTGFYVKGEDLKKLGRRIGKHIEELAAEDEIQTIYDFDKPVDEWKDRKTATQVVMDLRSFGVDRNYTAQKIGLAIKSLNKRLDEDQQIKITNTHNRHLYLMPPLRTDI